MATVGAVVTLSACGRQPQWYDIASATVSPDGKTVTVTAQVGSCHEITSSTVSEQATDVTIGIRVRDNCEPLFPWEEGLAHTDMAYYRKVELHLKNPLADRRLIDQTAQREIPILEQQGGRSALGEFPRNAAFDAVCDRPDDFR
ncbi:hypothetical protein EDD27_0848 [Nonomuraea polychroma]|uniref:Uncharacterized protein n=1 Tax=Nonomuraea polychroma TaxID=46176 RepID=A0A438LYB1_9ACTN|nr:hypothetical protein [Nonomuraea polychroma]RVX38534.1 hypothetical protein EDD27_0848 [Nonomuraea polychroma]